MHVRVTNYHPRTTFHTVSLGTWVNSGPRPSGDLQLRSSAPPHLLVSVQEFAECRLLACAIVVHERGHHASVLPKGSLTLILCGVDEVLHGHLLGELLDQPMIRIVPGDRRAAQRAGERPDRVKRIHAIVHLNLPSVVVGSGAPLRITQPLWGGVARG